MIPDLQPLLACPQCTYDRFMPEWVGFAFVRLFVFCLVASRRLDVVRVLGLFTAFELAYLYFWRLGNWYAHPGAALAAANSLSDFFLQFPNGKAILEGLRSSLTAYAESCLLFLVSGIPAALVMKGVSRIPYFRVPGRPLLGWTRALLLVPTLFGLAYLQNAQAFR